MIDPWRGELVGRERELAELRAALDDTCAGRGGVVTITGEAGIGKTRLAHELGRQAADRGALVLWGSCWEAGGAPSYWPWVQLIRAFVAVTGADAVASRSDTTVLAPIVPGLFGSDGPQEEALRSQVFELEPGDPQRSRFRLFDAVVQLFAAGAALRPTVLILDDLHAADEPSLLLLRYVERALRGAPVLAIAIYRETDVRREERIELILSEIGRERSRLSLLPLEETETERLVGTMTAGRASPALIRALHCASEGNPFFLTEMVRDRMARGIRDGEDESPRVPDEVREAIRRRLRSVDADAMEVLATAAVLGREIDLSTLRAVAGERDVWRCLRQAEQAGIVAALPGPDERYRFAHVLFCETLYADLPAAERARLHGRAAEALIRLHGRDLDPHLATVAHHFSAAVGGGHAEEAIAYQRRAGDRALRLLAYEHAEQHYQSALNILEQRPGDPAVRCRILLSLADAQRRCQALPLAKETFLKAADAARRQVEAGDEDSRELFARAALGFAITQPVTGVIDAAVVGLLEEAVVLLDSGDSGMRARLLARLAWALYFAPASFGRRSALTAEAIAMARRLEDADVLAFVLTCAHYALWDPQNLDDRLVIAEELIELARRQRNPELELAGYISRVVDSLERGDIAEVDAGIAACTRISGELRNARGSWYLLRFRTMRALLRGQFADAEELMQQTLAAGAGVDKRVAANIFAVQLAALRMMQGRYGELEPILKGMIEQQPAMAAWRGALAYLYAERGRHADARRELDVLASNGLCALPRDVVWLTALAQLSEVCGFLGDSERAAILYEQLAPYAGRCVVVEYGIACLGAASRYLGVLAAAMNRWEESEAHFRDAVEMHRRLGALPWLARTQEQYGRMLLARGRPHDSERAGAMIEKARTTYRQMGMSGFLAADDDGESRGVQPRPSASRGAAPAVFRNHDGSWAIGFGDDAFRLGDLHGLRYIAYLLAHPGVCVGAADLLAATGVQRPSVSVERSRVAVTKAVAVAFRKIGEHSPGLRAYLAETIRTGRVCSYVPSPSMPLRWEL